MTSPARRRGRRPRRAPRRRRGGFRAAGPAGAGGRACWRGRLLRGGAAGLVSTTVHVMNAPREWRRFRRTAARPARSHPEPVADPLFRADLLVGEQDEREIIKSVDRRRRG